MKVQSLIEIYLLAFILSSRKLFIRSRCPGYAQPAQSAQSDLSDKAEAFGAAPGMVETVTPRKCGSGSAVSVDAVDQ
jgi:hypothetical protein